MSAKALPEEHCGAKRVLDGLLFNGQPGVVAVGIDQSYSGFALTALNVNHPERFYTWLYAGKGTGTARLVDIQTFLLSVMDVLDRHHLLVEEIAVEGYAPGAKFGREMAGELVAAVRLALHPRLEPVVVSPMALKKYATGKGAGVSKQQILLAVYKKWGVEFTDDNMADSYVIAHVAAGKPVHRYEREVVAAVFKTPAPA